MVVKWATHYSSMHSILLVGEGDFSFSLSLANAFGSASNIVATSLDSHDTVVKKYDQAKENLENLRKLGAMILHEIDATKMGLHPKLMQKFDRIIFNFPHAGFVGKENNVLVIKHHRQLVNGFLKNASHMLRQCGEVHISHKISDPYHMWNLEELASNNSLVLTECVNFDIKDYPGYRNKRGDEPRCNESFPLGECKTFMFKIGNPRKRRNAMESMNNSCYLESFSSSHQPATPIYPQEGIMNTLQWSSGSGFPNAFMNMRRGSVFNAYKVFRSNEDPSRSSFQAYANEMPRNTVIGYSINQVEPRIRRLSRTEWLRYLISKHGKEKEAVHFG